MSLLLAGVLTSCGAQYQGQTLLGHLLPYGTAQGYDVRSYVLTLDTLTEGVSASRSRMDDLYFEALQRCHGNKEAASLATLIAVLEHRHVPLRLGVDIDIPLTLESPDLFRSRVRRLPSSLYSDRYNDRDKLQHFFANAWLDRWVGMTWIVRTVGELIELGEDSFVEGGAYDLRDKIANQDGERFSSASGDSLEARPSSYLSSNP